MGFKKHAFDSAIKLEKAKIHFQKAQGNALAESITKCLKLSQKIIDTYKSELPQADYQNFPGNEEQMT